MKKFFLACSLLLTLSQHTGKLLSFDQQEFISDLHSKITINSDASLTVTETITVQVEHQLIKRGITRSFPTCYQNRFGDFVNVGFKVITTKLDQKPCSYFLTSAPNGVIVNFGTSSWISKGPHVYEITYQTNRQLAFKDGWTELYFNIVGNNVIFPVRQTSAEIYLPQDVHKDQIELCGYTGNFGSKKQNYQSWVTAPNTCRFKTTQALQPGQSFTISVAFPDSISIKKPNFLTKLKWFIKDNFDLFILILLIIILLIAYSLAYYQVDLDKPVITPLFNPPANMLPADCAFLYHKSLPNSALTATIIDMAIHGYLKIRYTPGSFLKTESYILEKTSLPPKIENPKYTHLAEIWFDKSQTVKLDRYNHPTVNKVLNRIAFLTRSYADYIKPTSTILVIGFIFSFCASLVALILEAHDHTLSFILIFVLIAINLIFYYLLKDYTPAGKRIYAQVAGFKMYLEYAEKDRIARLNPPTMTVELFEKYLPYAIALGVDSAWTSTFDRIYAQVAGQAYQPHWWIARDFHLHSFRSDLHKFNNNINTIIVPTAAPGSSSGRSGGGFSGGGGGGGGIGGR